MRRWTLRLCALAAACLGMVGTADAATSFTMQVAPQAIGTPVFSLNGDQVSGFSATVRPTSCTSPNWQNSSDSVFEATIPAGADVQLQNGAFSYSGTAPSAYYSGSAGSGGQFTVHGTVNPSHTLLTGTVTLSGAKDPFVSGCSGSYHIVAIPTVTPAGVSPDKRAYQSQFIHFDDASGVIRNLFIQANFQCGAGGEDAATVNAAQYGYRTLQTTASGGFRMTAYVLDEYKQIVVLTITGTVKRRHASGRVVVSEPPGGFTAVWHDPCSGNYAWSASKPAAPPKPGPTAYFQWAAIRVPVGTAYKYYFAVHGLKCTRHANALRVTVKGRSITIPCSHKNAFATHSLAPSRTYSVKSQALERRHGRIVKRGRAVVVPLQMPGPGDSWTPISGLPGTPPS